MGYLAAAILFAAVTGFIAQRKGYSFALWAVLGGLFTFVALVILAMLPDREDFRLTGESYLNVHPDGPRTLCPQCGEFIPTKAKVCHFCKYDLVARPEPNLGPLPVSRLAERTELLPESKLEPALLEMPEAVEAAPAKPIPLPKRDMLAEQELLLRAANTRSRLAFLIVIPLFFVGIAVCGFFALKFQRPTTLPVESKPVATKQAQDPARSNSESSEDDSAASEPESRPQTATTPPPVVMEDPPPAVTPPRTPPASVPVVPAPVVVARPPSVPVRPPTMPEDETDTPATEPVVEEKKVTKLDTAKAELDDANDQLAIVNKVMAGWERKLKSATNELDKAKAALAEAKNDVAAEQAYVNDATAVAGAARTNIDVAQANRKLKEANWRLNLAQGKVSSAEKTLATKQATWNEVDKATTLVKKQIEECERTIKSKSATVEQIEASQTLSSDAGKK